MAVRKATFGIFYNSITSDKFFQSPATSLLFQNLDRLYLQTLNPQPVSREARGLATRPNGGTLARNLKVDHSV